MTRRQLRQRGFVGFVTFEELRNGGLNQIPREPGVYVVLAEGTKTPAFVRESAGGRHKGRDPSVPIEMLEAKWTNSEVIYIGKANVLRRRISELSRFGQGSPAGHWGGRMLWQLPSPEKLVVAWMSTPDEDPRQVEVSLLADFSDEYGALPFANLA